MKKLIPLQNIPIRTEVGKEIRKALERRILAPVDYSEIELRILAQILAEEPKDDQK